MVVTAQDLKNAGIDVPILVGGAALTRKFTETRISPEYDGLVLYAKDAMQGLELANQLMNPEQRQKLVDEMRKLRESHVMKSGADDHQHASKVTSVIRSNVSRDVPVFTPPDLERHILRNYPIDMLVPYVNMQMLLGHHLGLKGRVDKLLAEGDEKALRLKEIVDQIFLEAKTNHILEVNGMYRFFPAQSDGNDIIIYDPEDRTRVLKTFTFPRQPKEPYLCLADFLRSRDSGEMDYVGFLVVTAGRGVRERAERWKEEGEYLRSHALQAAALEIAEAMAERVHHIMRDVWGFPGSAGNDDERTNGGALSRNPRFVRLSGLSEFGRSEIAV